MKFFCGFIPLVLGAALAVAPPTASGAPAPPTAPPPIAATPPMGWNTWYGTRCHFNEQLIEQTADAMVSSGMHDAGYNYVNLDDCWMSHSRDADGNLQADPVKFPHGITTVADYLHARGLKLGIYEDAGTTTCGGYPGSYGHIQQDADTFASWGVDFVKVDWCNVPFDNFPGRSKRQVAQQLYGDYSSALKHTGRPMLLSICEWDTTTQPWAWAPAISSMWRTNNDTADNWASILANLDGEANIAQYAGPGHWNDADMLQVALGGMSTNEDQAHFSAWAMLAAPLLASNDLNSMSAATKAILTNREVIAIDQDPLGKQATRISHNGDADVWVRPLANGDQAVMLLNRGPLPLTVDTTAQAAGLGQSSTYAVRDLWAHRTTESAGRLAASVPPNSAVLYRVTPLHGVGAYPSATDMTVATNVPADYPGSPYHIVQPGQTVDVTATFRNDGRRPVRDVALSLTGQPVHAAAVPGDGELAGTWQVTVPAGTAPGLYPLSASTTYRGGSTTGQSGIWVMPAAPRGTVPLGDVKWLDSTGQGWPLYIDQNDHGAPLTIHGTAYPKGFSVHANASFTYYLGGNCTRLTADLGFDDSDPITYPGGGTVAYQVFADGMKVFDSGTVTGHTTPTVHLDQDVRSARVLQLVLTDAGDGNLWDRADVAAPQLTCAA